MLEYYFPNRIKADQLFKVDHFPFEERRPADVTTEVMAVCWFTYNILIKRLYYHKLSEYHCTENTDAVWTMEDKDSKYSHFVLPLNQKIVNGMERRIFSEIESFDFGKELIVARFRSTDTGHDVKFTAEDIGVDLKIDFHGSHLDLSIEQLFEMQSKWVFELIATKKCSYEWVTRHYPLKNIVYKAPPIDEED